MKTGRSKGCSIPALRRIILPKGVMAMEEKLPHKLQLSDREKLTMTGVTEVVSFEDTAVVLRTVLGTLLIQGQELKLRTLSLEGGQVAVDGRICALVYEEPRESLWRRLLG